MNHSKEDINRTLRTAQVCLFIGLVCIIVGPIILLNHSMWYSLDSEKTGQMGDTIGGLTAPIVNLLGAILVYFALKAQTQANQLFQEQIERDNDAKEIDSESANLNQLYNHLNENINNFKFTRLYSGLSPEALQVSRKELKGGEAFNEMFSQINCQFHGSEEDLLKDPCVSELYSILSIMYLILQKLEITKSKNKENLKTLVHHQFEYKIITRIRGQGNEELKVEYCSDCKCNHGIPNNILDLIKKIKLLFGDEPQLN